MKWKWVISLNLYANDRVKFGNKNKLYYFIIELKMEYLPGFFVHWERPIFVPCLFFINVYILITSNVHIGPKNYVHRLKKLFSVHKKAILIK